MKPTSRVIVSVAVFALVNVVANAQAPAELAKSRKAPAASTGPVKVISQAEFNQMVQSGQQFIPVTPAILAAQDSQTQATNQQNQAVVNEFMSQNPNLAGLAGLFAPPTDPSVVRTFDGNYTMQLTDAQGHVDTVETLGPGSILADLAAAIQAASDPVQQLALYQSLYTQYAALYSQLCPASPGGNNGCASLTPPSKLTNPAALQNASLGSIKSALQGLGSQGLAILKQVPVPPIILSSQFASCSADLGASLKATQVNYGDQTGNSKCSGTPNAAGILENFNWLNKDLLTCVKSQGGRGTCHIFASTSAIEMLIARDTGDKVNLSEEDFEEHEKLLWRPAYSNTGGQAGNDLNDAQSNSYHFAYENQWDYNTVGQIATATTCDNYPYPKAIAGFLEPGCSASAPQAPEWCVGTNADCSKNLGCAALAESVPPSVFTLSCYFTTAKLSGARSPYMSNGATSIWDPTNPDLSVANILLSLAFNNAVILAFSETSDFKAATRTPAEEKKDKAPTGYVVYHAKKDAQGIVGASDGKHAVHIVGYIDNGTLAGNPATKSAPAAAGGGYFIIKNSWGECHGDAGYYYMPVDYLKNRALHVWVVSSVTH
jgi:hypothetical protein